MQFHDALLELCALRQLGLIVGQNLIDWGVMTLEKGYDSPALRRLAGCYSHESLADVELWFDQALVELKLDLAKFEMGPLFRPYSRLLASQVLAGDAEALCPELSQMDPEDCIRAECELFLAFSAFNELREDLFLLAYCPSCKTFAKPLYLPVKQPWNETLLRLITRGYQPHTSVCSKCERPDPLSLGTVAGRRTYLKKTDT